MVSFYRLVVGKDAHRTLHPTMTIITIRATNEGVAVANRRSQFTVRLPRPLACCTVALRQYAVETYDARLFVRVDLPFIGADSQAMTAEETQTTGHHLILPTHTAVSKGSGTSFATTAQLDLATTIVESRIPAAFTVSVFDESGNPYVGVRDLVLTFETFGTAI